MTKRPINDVSEHFQKHEGMPNEKVDFKKLPKFIRWIGYFLIGCMGLATILYILILIFQ